MAKLFMTNVKGFSKEEAMCELPLEINQNATAKWRAAGEPTFGSDDFRAFAENFISNKHMITGAGAYIQKTSPIADTRTKPYKIVNFKKEGKTKWETVYNVCEAEFNLDKEGKFKSIESIGMPVDQSAVNKADAEHKMRELIAQNKRNYVVRKTKEVVEDEASKNGEILCAGVYTPSITTKQGEFYVFGLVKE